MIVNPWTVSCLSLDALSSGVGLAALALGAKQLAVITAGRSEESGESTAREEDHLYLLFWLGAVFLVMRFLAWPLFYLSLHSIVDEVIGAMCIFGTRNLLPTLTRVIELIKPLLFYCGLVWLILFRLERFDCKAGQNKKGRITSLLLLIVCLVVGLVESTGSVILWIMTDPELAVSCCTTITDIPSRFTVWVPQALFGPGFSSLLWGLYFTINICLICTCLWAVQVFQASSRRTMWLTILILLAVVNSVVGIFSYIEVIAPVLMGLPFHHCLYCMVQNVGDGAIMLGLFVLGNMMIGAALPSWKLAMSWADEKSLVRLITRLLNLGAICLAGPLLMLLVHLVR